MKKICHFWMSLLFIVYKANKKNPFLTEERVNYVNQPFTLIGQGQALHQVSTFSQHVYGYKTIKYAIFQSL